MTGVVYNSIILDCSKQIILRCPFQACNVRIIPCSEKLLASKIQLEQTPTMMMPSGETKHEEEYFFRIDDVWDFDNIGVSRPASDLAMPILIPGTGEDDKIQLEIERLLICSECDKGPLGFAGIHSGEELDHKNLKYFLSCASVLYEEK